MTSVLSETLKHALSLRETSRTCPADFAKACSSLALFHEGPSATGGQRFTGLSGSSRPAPSEDGFEPVHGRKGRGYGGRGVGYGGSSSGYGGHSSSSQGGYGGRSYNGGGFNRNNNSNNNNSNSSNNSTHSHHTGMKRTFGSSAPVLEPAVDVESKETHDTKENVVTTTESKEVVPVTPVIAFSSAAVRTGVSSRDRVLQRIKGKINRMGFNTYDKTKESMREMLDGDEIEYLDEILAYIFQKAATESMYCALFAKLLHELSGEFPHFRTAMRKLFQDYTAIFTEGVKTAEHDSEEYKHWLDIQERKKFRRGYSQFVSELVKLGEAEPEAFARLLDQSVSVLEASVTNVDKVHLSEEYSDCLQTMCISASALLSTASWSAGLVSRIEALSVYELASKPPGFSTRGLVILKNLTDYAKRGWKPLSL